ncbi:unnamed protein product, partial [Iphiclides podalirius]
MLRYGRQDVRAVSVLLLNRSDAELSGCRQPCPPAGSLVNRSHDKKPRPEICGEAGASYVSLSEPVRCYVSVWTQYHQYPVTRMRAKAVLWRCAEVRGGGTCERASNPPPLPRRPTPPRGPQTRDRPGSQQVKRSTQAADQRRPT